MLGATFSVNQRLQRFGHLFADGLVGVPMGPMGMDISLSVFILSLWYRGEGILGRLSIVCHRHHDKLLAKVVASHTGGLNPLPER